MKKYVCKMLLYLLWGAIIVAVMDWMSAIRYTSESMRMQEMYQWPENIDILFMGSSHTCYSYDPKLADEILGAETFNLGSSGQLPVTTYYLLKEAEMRNKIDTVYLDTYFEIYAVDISPDEGALYTVSDYMAGGRNRIGLLWAAGKFRGIEKGILERYARNLREADIRARICGEKFSIGDYEKLASNGYEYREKGFIYRDGDAKIEIGFDFQEAAERKSLPEGDVPMSDDAYEYLIKIIDFCEENDICLVLVDQPMPDELLSRVDGYGRYVAFLSELADQYGIAYMNFNLYKGYEKTLDDYFDDNHLNGPGAERYTRIFCDTVNALQNQEKSMDDFFYQTYTPNRVE